jgi:hypothetical protein
MQFYFIFPFIILFFYKNFKNNILVINFIIILLSFLLSTILFYFDRSFAFYNLPARLWQFFLGSTIYFLKKDNILSNNIFSYIGFSLILLAVFLFENNNSHLVFISILPSIGSFLLINNLNKNNFINKFLSFKIIIFIGTISYSLYLVHYIVMSFFRVSLIADSNITNKLIIFILIIVLSIGSYYLIEKPFKKKLNKFYLVIIFFITSIFAIQITKLKTIFFNHDPFIKPWEQIASGNNICFNIKENFCYFQNKKSDKEIVILGDSLSASVQSILTPELYKIEFNILNITNSNCSFFFKTDQYKKNNLKTDCNYDYQKKVFNIINSSKDKIFIIYLNYNSFLKDFKYKKIDNNKSEFMSESEVKENFIKSLEIILKNNKVIIVYPTFKLKYELDRILFAHLPRNEEKRSNFLKNTNNWLTYSQNQYFLQNNEVIELLDSINNRNLIKIFPNKIFCVGEKCFIHNQKDVYYYDAEHLSLQGSKLLSDQIIKVIKDSNL